MAGVFIPNAMGALLLHECVKVPLACCECDVCLYRQKLPGCLRYMYGVFVLHEVGWGRRIFIELIKARFLRPFLLERGRCTGVEAHGT